MPGRDDALATAEHAALLSHRVRRGPTAALTVALVLALGWFRIAAAPSTSAPAEWVTTPPAATAAPLPEIPQTALPAPFVADVDPPPAANVEELAAVAPPATPEPAVTGEAAPRSLFDGPLVVSYYGNPLARQLGVLGEYPPEEVIRRLRAQASAYAALDPGRQVVPAIHLIYAVAQGSPGGDGEYLLRMDDGLVRPWLTLTRDEGLLLFLDIQVGRSSVVEELKRVFPYLEEAHVHVALDPEFAWPADITPVTSIGHLTAGQVNEAQDLLERFVVERGLPNKALVVHRFRRDMLRDIDQLEPHAHVDLVIDADGFGSPALKLAQWNDVIRRDNVPLAAIKLFYHQDAQHGRLLREDEVLALEPRPVLVIYQ